MLEVDFLNASHVSWATDMESTEEFTGVPDRSTSLSGWPIPSLADILYVRPSKIIHTISTSMEDIGIALGTFLTSSAPTQLSIAEVVERLVQHLILLIKTSQTILHGNRIADRLSFLENSLKDEDLSGVGIRPESLRTFYTFLDINTRIKVPALTVTPQNNIYACWEDAEGYLFSVHFLPSPDVRFVIFKPDNRHRGRSIRLSGTATVDALSDVISANGMSTLISE